MDLSDVLDDAEQLRIVNTLGRLTVSDKIAWQPVGKDVSLTALGSHRYELSSQDNDGEPPYSLTIFRKEKVDQQAIGHRIIATILMRPSFDPKSNDEINSGLRELYEDAYRKSRRNVSKIDEVLNELDGVERGDLPPF